MVKRKPKALLAYPRKIKNDYINPVGASKRIVKQFSKKVSKDAAMDMSVQFLVSFVGGYKTS
ncbi:MAG: hypothetical protein ACOC22_04485 [bacterium]